ncbi:hypothetical protein CLU79DRAFT_762176 [Phycomyces nitens]|nr:hypothetical protein CLU79DRAFT_762176 [Phycomyces nitens]
MTYQQLFALSAALTQPTDVSDGLRILTDAFPETQLPFPTSVDEWLADDLCHSGLLMMPPIDPNNLFKQTPQDLQQALQQLLPVSPPLTASPPNTIEHSLEAEQHPIRVPLFPEIPRQRVLMPKTSTTCPRTIAPRPSTMPVTIESKKRPVDDKDGDDIAVKRQKNTDAARRSRLKKLKRMECLEERVSELETDNTRLTTRIAVLESEKSGLESKDRGLEERVRILEQQLAEAHRALTSTR